MRYRTLESGELTTTGLLTPEVRAASTRGALCCLATADEQTRTHEQVLLTVFEELGLNPETVSPGREVVAHFGDSLVTSMEMAKARGSAAAAQLVAGECREQA